MMRDFILTIILLTFSLLGVAQNHIDAINEVKLSGKYFTAEATASNIEDANKLALLSLIENISGYCEEMELPKIPEDKVKAALLSKSVKRGDVVLVLVYVPRDIVKATGTMTFTPYNHASEANNTETITNSHTSTVNVQEGVPDIIKQISNVDTYASMQYLLNLAEDNGLIASWGKKRLMSNPDNCYMIMVNTDRQIKGVLSPMMNGQRKNVKTGVMLDSESMNEFANCVPFCVLIK